MKVKRIRESGFRDIQDEVECKKWVIKGVIRIRNDSVIRVEIELLFIVGS